MTKEIIKRFFKFINLGRITVAMLICVMLLFAGCDKQELPVKTDSSVSSSSEPDNVVSDDTASDNSSSEATDSQDTSLEDTSTNINSNVESKEETNGLEGDYSYEITSSNYDITVNEIIPVGNTANLSNPLKGYADDAAEDLREDILNTGNTEEYYKITGTKYYVSSLNGDDNNSGTSPEEAFESIEAINNLDLKFGDAVLFERGSVFRLYTTFLASEGVTYGSYGEGEKPKIYGSPLNLVEMTWTPSVKKNVWQTDYIYSDCGSIIFNHGKDVGYSRNNLRGLTKNTDFFQDQSTDILYVYCDKGNPSKVYESIEIATQMSIIGIPGGVSNITVDNLCLKYSGVFAVSATWDSSNINVTNCEIGYIGGGTTEEGARYGNAIQFWTGSKSIRCDHNWIYQTFDTAITWQGFGGEKFSYEDISFSDNLLEYNNGDFEFWDEGSTVKNFTMAGNIMRFTSLGWGTRADDGGFRGIDGCFVGDTNDMTIENIHVENNIIDCPGRMIFNWYMSTDDINNRIFFSGTEIYVNSSYRTDDEIIRGLTDSNGNSESVFTTVADEFINAFRILDSSALLEWN